MVVKTISDALKQGGEQNVLPQRNGIQVALYGANASPTSHLLPPVMRMMNTALTTAASAAAQPGAIKSPTAPAEDVPFAGEPHPAPAAAPSQAARNSTAPPGAVDRPHPPPLHMANAEPGGPDASFDPNLPAASAAPPQRAPSEGTRIQPAPTTFAEPKPRIDLLMEPIEEAAKLPATVTKVPELEPGHVTPVSLKVAASQQALPDQVAPGEDYSMEFSGPALNGQKLDPQIQEVMHKMGISPTQSGAGGANQVSPAYAQLAILKEKSPEAFTAFAQKIDNHVVPGTGMISQNPAEREAVFHDAKIAALTATPSAAPGTMTAAHVENLARLNEVTAAPQQGSGPAQTADATAPAKPGDSPTGPASRNLASAKPGDPSHMRSDSARGDPGSKIMDFAATTRASLSNGQPGTHHM
ncbi:MAG: hypothetical protein AB7H77_08920, partial [Bdellovibrionales bacterium]